MEQNRVVTAEVYELLRVAEFDLSTKQGKCDIASFHADYNTISQVAEILGDDFLDGRQNDSPSVRDFLDALQPFAATTTFHGYVVSPGRPDERVSIEAVTTNNTPETRALYHRASTFDQRGAQLYAWWT